MCGFIGFFNHSGLPEKFQSRPLMRRLVHSMSHRGPDESGGLLGEIAHLGQARLNIIDPEYGHQPMLSEDRRLAVVFNGEIYNFRELRRGLLRQGHPLKTNCDTEVLLYMYRQYGAEMLERLNGQFSFAIIDFERRRLFMARDRVGIRPLFYSELGETIVFGSTVMAVAAGAGLPPRPNPRAFIQYANLWSTFNGETFIDNCRELEPGESLEYDTGEPRRRLYWDLTFPPEPEKKRPEEWAEQARYALVQATRARLRADVPVNSYLSGGLDSSIILRLAKQNHPRIESYSVRFSEDFYDETEFQTGVIESLGAENRHLTVNPHDIGTIFPQVIRHAGQPVFRTAPAPMFMLSKMVQDRGSKVVLTGEGADEIAYGYNIFKENLIRLKLHENPNDKFWLDKIPELHPHLDQFDRKYQFLLKSFYRESVVDPGDPLFTHRLKLKNGDYPLAFMNKDFIAGAEDYSVRDDFADTTPPDFIDWTVLQRTQYIEMKTLLKGYLLSSQGDRMSMAHGVEGRYPFLDHKVIKLFSSMPDEVKLNGFNEKSVLKNAFRDQLPRSVVQRNKHPYRAPEAVSLATPEIEERYLTPEKMGRYGLFDEKKVGRLRKKIHQNIAHANFSDNFAYVYIISTMMFMDSMEQISNVKRWDEKPIREETV